MAISPPIKRIYTVLREVDKMEYRVVMSDMDETFLDERHQIPPANLQALEYLHNQGVLFVPSSGRPYSSILSNFGDAHQALLQDSYVISYNGGFINRVGNNQPLHSCALDSALAHKLYRIGVEANLCIHVCFPDGYIVVLDPPAEERAYLVGLSGVALAHKQDFPSLEAVLEHYGYTEVVKFCVMSEHYPELLDLGASLKPELVDEPCDITYSSGRYLEFMPQGVNKGSGLRSFSQLVGIPPEQIIAVGDARNDLEMVKAAGLGLCVANASSELKAQADVVLKSSNRDGALVEIVERFFS
ncbi:Cof-type HAD-IIB family hydrolase [Collinsella sp. zg1085]|uniref:HAD family hydrolase n=1 Tax=Collinsella sp. zg1085 TaxID=2844380 RepID=UPI001C0ABF06|nr:HAD family hydrolase [Collinsella sp. zg1085]QWT17980.1 Cof-type HAD-IIB family hydrolase [Collinsella sp. zg1085]